MFIFTETVMEPGQGYSLFPHVDLLPKSKNKVQNLM